MRRYHVETVTPGERELVIRLVAEDERDGGDQLTRFEPGGWWLGSEQIDARLCWRLIRHALISEDSVQSGGTTYYHINGCGRRLAADSNYTPCRCA